MIYLIILILLLYFSYFYDIKGCSPKKNQMYIVVQILLILVAGLRYRIGSDTTSYIDSFYHEYPTLDAFSWEEYPIGKDPLYVLINAFVKTVGGRFYMVQLIQSTFVIVLVFKYIKKHSSYIFTCSFFYFILCFFSYNIEIMRGAMSIVVCLFANDYILKNKWIKGYLLYFVSILFHAQALIMLLIPLFKMLKMNKTGIVVLAVAYFAGIIIQSGFGDFADLIAINDSLNYKVARYAGSEKYSQAGGNMNFMLVFVLPWLFYSISSLYYVRKSRCNTSLQELESFVMIGIVFLMIQMNFQIAFRFVDYFRVYFVLFMSEMFIHLTKSHKNISLNLAYTRTWIIFLPFFLLIGYQFYVNYSFRFFPYSSLVTLSTPTALHFCCLLCSAVSVS